MEIIKRKLCIEDFINRNNTKSKDGETMWGKIAQNVDITVMKDDLVFNIGLYLEEVTPNEDINIDVWNESKFSYENVGKTYKITDGDVVIYKKLLHKKVLPFIITEQNKYILKYKNLTSLYYFLNQFNYDIEYYVGCKNKWVKLDENFMDKYDIKRKMLGEYIQ